MVASYNGLVGSFGGGITLEVNLQEAYILQLELVSTHSSFLKTSVITFIIAHVWRSRV